MGAWAHGSFDNDDALDWVGELEAADGIEPIAKAFRAVAGAKGDVEAPEASAALAAAEVVAALRGRPAEGLPEEVTAWVAGKPAPTAELAKAAAAAVARILDGSELKELWGESEDAALWQADVEDLQRRLSA